MTSRRRCGLLRSAALAALLGGFAAVSTGCGGGSSTPAAGGPATTGTPAATSAGQTTRTQAGRYPTVPAVSPCPSPTTGGTSFPAGAASDVPHPGFATAPTYLPVSVHGVALLRFETAMPLRDAVEFVLAHYPSSGYTIGRGDAEAREADVPFVGSAVHGTTRLTETGTCSTEWLVATESSAGGPLSAVPQLAPHYTSAPPSFGSS